jgi:hypothetical protein
MFVFLEKVIESTNPEPLSPVSLIISQAIIQAKRSNDNVVEISDNSLVLGKGIELVKPTDDVQLPSVTIGATGVGNNFDLKDLSILGSIDDGVNILYEIY